MSAASNPSFRVREATAWLCRLKTLPDRFVATLQRRFHLSVAEVAEVHKLFEAYAEQNDYLDGLANVEAQVDLSTIEAAMKADRKAATFLLCQAAYRYPGIEQNIRSLRALAEKGAPKKDRGSIYVYRNKDGTWAVEDCTAYADSCGWQVFHTREAAVDYARRFAQLHGHELTIGGGELMDDFPSLLLAAALGHARAGRPVFPCNGEKQPLIAGGFKNASRDETQIRVWWGRWPLAMIAVPTGRASGLVVIDIDVKNGADGFATARNIGLSLDAPACVTPSGGMHLLFRCPADCEIRSSAGKLGPGIDVRGEGGYIIAPPSRPSPDRPAYILKKSRTPHPLDWRTA